MGRSLIKYTTVKVSREMHDALTRRSSVLGMAIGEYVQRLLWLAMEQTTDDPIEEFKTLLAFAQRREAGGSRHGSANEPEDLTHSDGTGESGD